MKITWKLDEFGGTPENPESKRVDLDPGLALPSGKLTQLWKMVIYSEGSHETW